MKLYIDDVRDAPEGWALARTTEEAIRMIAVMGTHIREISFDYNIAVAYFIGEKYRLVRLTAAPTLRIHSTNPDGAKEMQEILKGYGLAAEYDQT